MRPRLHFLAWKTFSEERLEQKHPQTLKKCSRRKIETDLDEHLYFRPKNTYQTSRASALHSQLVTIQTFPMWQFSSKLHKTVVIRSYVCRTALIRNALERPDLWHRMVGQTCKTDTLGPTWRLLKWLGGPKTRISEKKILCWDSRFWTTKRLQIPPWCALIPDTKISKISNISAISTRDSFPKFLANVKKFIPSLIFDQLWSKKNLFHRRFLRPKSKNWQKIKILKFTREEKRRGGKRNLGEKLIQHLL